MNSEEEINTICGCTKTGMLSSQARPCYECGHANGNHNFGKGCRVSYKPKFKAFYLEEPRC